MTAAVHRRYQLQRFRQRCLKAGVLLAWVLVILFVGGVWSVVGWICWTVIKHEP